MIYCILYFTRQKGIRLRQLARPLSIVERLFCHTAHCILYILNFLICQKRLCVYGKFFFLLFSNSYNMDIAQCIEVNTTPALAEIHVEAERPQQPLRQAVFVAVPVNSKIHYSMRTVISWFTTKNSRDWSRLSISLSNAFRNSRACWMKIPDVWTL